MIQIYKMEMDVVLLAKSSLDINVLWEESHIVPKFKDAGMENINPQMGSSVTMVILSTKMDAIRLVKSQTQLLNVIIQLNKNQFATSIVPFQLKQPP